MKTFLLRFFTQMKSLIVLEHYETTPLGTKELKNMWLGIALRTELTRLTLPTGEWEVRIQLASLSSTLLNRLMHMTIAKWLHAYFSFIFCFVAKRNTLEFYEPPYLISCWILSNKLRSMSSTKIARIFVLKFKNIPCNFWLNI